jgi:hypothetical protein
LAYDDSTKAFSIVANQNATTSLTLSNNSTGSSSLITSTLISDTAVGNSLLYGSGRVNNNVNQYQTGASYIIDYQGPVSLNLSSTFASGSNSGIRFWTASSTSNGVERMRIASTGNVLINTTTDAGFRLDVNGTARVSGNSFFATTSGNVGIGTSSPSHKLTIAQDGYNLRLANTAAANGYNIGRNNANGLLYFYGDQSGFNGYVFDGINGERMRIAGSTGNVLINTTTDAGFRLDVNGTARVTGTGNVFTINHSSNNRTFTFNPSYATDVYGGLISHSTSNITLNANIGTDSSFVGIFLGGVAGSRNASARLQIDDTTRGFLPPRMTTTQKNAISSPATGLQVYDTTLNQMSYYNGTTWTNI